jgi:hypothetical protein
MARRCAFRIPTTYFEQRGPSASTHPRQARRSSPLDDLFDAVPSEGDQQGNDNEAAEKYEAEKAPSHGLVPMRRPRGDPPFAMA